MDANKNPPKRMKGGRDITAFIAHRVTPLPLPIQVGEIFLCPFLINSPTRFARRGIRHQCIGGYKVEEIPEMVLQSSYNLVRIFHQIAQAQILAKFSSNSYFSKYHHFILRDYARPLRAYSENKCQVLSNENNDNFNFF